MTPCLFYQEIAQRYGTLEAIMLQTMIFWIKENKKNGKNSRKVVINGEEVERTWTYNSIQDWKKYFKFLSCKQIENILNSLRQQGVIITGNYNPSKWMRTLWYALPYEKEWLDMEESTEYDEYTIHNKLDLLDSRDLTYKIEESIPPIEEKVNLTRGNLTYIDITTLNKPHILTSKEVSKTDSTNLFGQATKNFSKKVKEYLSDKTKKKEEELMSDKAGMKKVVDSTDIELFQEALKLGEFTNRSPVLGKPIAGLYLKSKAFLTLLSENPSLFAHKYELDPEWMKRNNIDLSYFKGRNIVPLLRRAAKRFAQMRKYGYYPQNKKVLYPYIQEFIYNEKTQKSWFLYCIFNEPKTLRDMTSKETVEISPDDRRVFMVHKKESWPEASFLKKTLELKSWYEQHKIGLRAYNYQIADSLQAWKENFSTFDRLLNTIDRFEKTWSQEWSIGNYGFGNKTWECFIDYCKKEYKISLSPSEKDVNWALHLDEKEKMEVKETKGFFDQQTDFIHKRAEEYSNKLLGVLA